MFGNLVPVKHAELFNKAATSYGGTANSNEPHLCHQFITLPEQLVIGPYTEPYLSSQNPLIQECL